MKFTYCPIGIAAITLSIITSAALASGLNTASFDSGTELTSSALSATIAASNINFQAPDTSYTGGNTITNSFNGGFGVTAINQNSGINSNVQQAITVKTGDVSIKLQ